MVNIALFPPGRLALEPGVRLLKAADYAVFVQASEIIAQAEAEAEKLRQQSQQAYEEQRQAGFAAGMAEGKAQMAEQLLDTMAASVDQVAAMEKQLVDVVMMSLRTILGSIDHEELTPKIVANALRLVRDEKKIILRVSEAESAAVATRLADMRRQYPGMGRVEIVSDPTLAKGGCVLETDIGVVDASLERQLEIIQDTFRRQLEERRL